MEKGREQVLKTVGITTFLDENAPYICTIPTRFADVDSNGHINNVATAQIVEDARTRFSEWMRVFAMIPAGITPLTVSLQIDYVGEARYPEPYVVHCAVSHVGRSSRSYLMTARQRNRVVAAAMSTQASSTGSGVWTLPDDMVRMLQNFSV